VNRLIRQLVLLLLLAWLPLQASAMPWLAFQCDKHDSGTGDHPAQHASLAHDAPSGDQNAGDGDDPGAVSDVHTCCHHFSGVVPTLRIATGAAITGGIAPHSPVLRYDFIPDLLKRPPLAHLV